jgi:hypothetical protein
MVPRMAKRGPASCAGCSPEDLVTQRKTLGADDCGPGGPGEMPAQYAADIIRAGLRPRRWAIIANGLLPGCFV